MSFFRDDEVIQGDGKNAVIALLCSLVALASGVLSLFYGSTLVVVTAGAFILGVTQSRKGKESDKRIIAVIAQVILVISVLAIGAWAVTTVLDAVETLFG